MPVRIRPVLLFVNGLETVRERLDRYAVVSAGMMRRVFNASYHKEALVRDDTLVQYAGPVERTQHAQDTTSSLRLDVSRLQELKHGILARRPASRT
ncbi:hypothetical protein PC117_g8602 [Phytophthora cactorum]|uniref:Uncharacterized protein n=1 Tax=Phytophthora cactorum TaxID=29920 RepID=A0A8T1E0N8_9STRA|nr:hypothetical protein PC117_g8602 [Phytophthora cactorum]